MNTNRHSNNTVSCTLSEGALPIARFTEGASDIHGIFITDKQHEAESKDFQLMFSQKYLRNKNTSGNIITYATKSKHPQRLLISGLKKNKSIKTMKYVNKNTFVSKFTKQK